MGNTTIIKRQTKPSTTKLSGLLQSYSDENTLGNTVPIYIGRCKMEAYPIADTKDVKAVVTKSSSSGGK